jgi:uroporphyrinogen-III synthase
VDLKSLPTLVSCGRGTSRALGEIGLRAGIAAERDFGAEGLLAAAEAKLTPGLRVLRLRSDKAGPALAQALAARGAVVDDCILYRNEPIQHDALPGFDAVLFASGSAVESFETQWGLEPPLRGKLVAAIGEPTSAALRGRGRAPDVVGPEATVDATLEALAARYVGLALEGDGR